MLPQDYNEIFYGHQIYERTSTSQFTIFAFVKILPTKGRQHLLTFSFTGSKEEARQHILSGTAQEFNSELQDFKKTLGDSSKEMREEITQNEYQFHRGRRQNIIKLVRRYKSAMHTYDSTFANPDTVAEFMEKCNAQSLPNPFILQFCKEQAEQLDIDLTVTVKKKRRSRKK